MAGPKATFIADFSQFQTAVDQANTKLVSFETESHKVQQSLDRMVTQFSGKKVIQEATLMASAIERIGGVTKLTASELQRFGTQAAEAMAVARARGEAVPKGLDALATAAKNAEAQTASLGGTFKDVFGGVLAANLTTKVISGITDIGKAAFETAGALSDLSAKTGLSTDTLQEMDYVGKQSGTNMQEFADAAYKMGINIQEGTAKARQGAIDLGLDWAKLRAASPDQQFHMVVDALEKMEDPQRRNTDAVALFGKTAAPILAAISSGYNEIAKNAFKAGDAQIKALDETGDAWDQFKDRFSKAQTHQLGSLTLAMQQLGKDPLHAMWEVMKSDSATSVQAVIDQLANLAIAEKHAADEAKNHGKDINLSIPPTFTERLKTAEQHFAALTKAERDQIEAGLAVGASNDDIINGLLDIDKDIKFTDDDLNLLKKTWQEQGAAAKKALAETEAELKKHDKALQESNKRTTQLMNEIVEIDESTTKTKNEREEAALTRRMNNEITAVRASSDLTVDAKEREIALIETKYGDLIKRIGVDWQKVNETSSEQLLENARNAQKTLDEMIYHGARREEIDKQTETVRHLWDVWAHGAEAAAEATDKTTEALARQGRGLDANLDRIKQFDAEWDEQRKKRSEIISSREVTGVPGQELLGGKTVADFAREIAQSGVALIPGQTLAQAAEAAFRQAAAEALRKQQQGGGGGGGYGGGYGGSGGGYEGGYGGSSAALTSRATAAADAARGVTVNMHVSGVWDPRSQAQLTQATQRGVTNAVSISRPWHWG